MAISVPDGSSGLFTRSTPIPCYGSKTMAAWVKIPSNNIAGHALGFLTIADSNITGEYYLTYDGGLEITCRNNTGNVIGAGLGTIADNKWHHICATVTAATPSTVTSVSFYLDGALNNSSSSPTVSGFENVGTGTFIGGQGSNYGTNNSLVDYVACWSKLLTAGEIAQLAAAADPRSIESANLVTFVSLQSATSNADLAPAASGVTWVASGTGIATGTAPFPLAPYPPPGPSFVQTATSGTPSGTATVKTATLTQSAGNLNILGITFGSAPSVPTPPTITISDTTGNTYTAIGAFVFVSADAVGSQGAGSILYYAKNIAAGANTVTVTLGSAQGFFKIDLFEYTGADPSNPIQTYSSGSAAGPGATISVSSGSLSTISANELIFGYTECFNSVASIDPTFTPRSSLYTTAAGDKPASTAGTYSFAATSGAGGGGWTAWAVAIQPPGAITGPPASFVQKANSGVPSGTGTTQSATLPNQTAGNMNFVYVSFGNGSGGTISQTVTSVQDDLSNAYLPAGPPAQATNGTTNSLLIQSFYRPNIPAGTRTITVTLSGAASFLFIGAAEYAIANASFVSAGAFSSDIYLSFSSSAAKTGDTFANANDLAIGFFACNNGMLATAGGGYTTRDQVYTIMLEDQQLVRPGIINATATTSGVQPWVGQVCIFHVSGVPASANGEVLLNDPFWGDQGDPTVLQNANSWDFWASGTGHNHWAGVNAGAVCNLTRFRFSVITGGEDLIQGCTITACNDPAFKLGPVTVWSAPAGMRALSGTLVNEVIVNSPTAYQYYRFNTGTLPTVAQVTGCVTDLDFYAQWAPGAIFQPADIALSPATGNFDLPTKLSLSCLTTSAVIYYTLDGSSPTGSSPVYSGPFTVGSSCTLQTLAVSSGQNGNSRTLSRPVHIGNTEVSLDILYDSRNYRVWAMNGSLFFDPVSHYWYRYGDNSDTPSYYSYGWPGTMLYRSADLRNWDFRAEIMQPALLDTQTNNRADILPRILYNAANNNYVMWTDTYTIVGSSYTGLGKSCWTAPSPEGPFTYQSTFTTIGPITGNIPSGGGAAVQGDFSLFLDSDGVTAYLISTCYGVSAANDTLLIAQLNSTYTGFSTATTYSWGIVISGSGSGNQEAPWMIKVGSTYFLMFSGTMGFACSPCKYVTASSPMGPFTPPALLPFQAVPGGDPDYLNSYFTQIWQIVTVPGRSGGYIYHGDQYTHSTAQVNPFPNLRRVRLPAVFSGNALSINWLPAWGFDAQMPNISGAPAAPSNLSVSSVGTSATWTNNEPHPCKLYFDQAADPNFSQTVSSTPLPDGAINVSGIQVIASPTYNRVRAVNASGTSTSNVAQSGGVMPPIIPPQGPTGPAFGNPPFLPLQFPITIPATKPGGGWNTYTGPWEDGASIYANSGAIIYNGQGQIALINTAYPLPPRHVLPAIAPPVMSQIR